LNFRPEEEPLGTVSEGTRPSANSICPVLMTSRISLSEPTGSSASIRWLVAQAPSRIPAVAEGPAQVRWTFHHRNESAIERLTTAVDDLPRHPYQSIEFTKLA
jgi:hypothetical protein